MKTFKKHINILVLSVMMFSSLSCSDFLEEENRSFQSDLITSADPAFFDQLVNEVYNRMRGATSAYDLEHTGTDIFTRGEIIAGINEINDYVNLRPINFSLFNHWNVNYRVISAANAAIDRAEVISGITAENKTRGIAEVKFFRAFAYFSLVEHFGGVPLVLNEIRTSDTNFSRATEQEVYDQIIADLNEALSGVPDSPAVYGRVTKNAVRHLMSKVLLTKGYKTFGTSADFTQAASLAETVITAHPLVDSFSSLVSRENQRNSEVIFSILYGRNQVSRGVGNSRHLLFKFVYDVYPGQTRSTLYHRGLGSAPTPFFFNLFEEGDQRESATIRRLLLAEVNSPSANIMAGDTSIYFPKTPWSMSVIESKPYVVVNPGDYFTPNGISQVQYPMFRKFDDPGVPYTNPGINPDGERDAVIMRSGETRLLAAEAYLQLNNTAKAAEHLNAIRSRAGLNQPITPAQVTIDLILDESAKELAGEVSRWMDLKRTGRLIDRVLAHNPHAALNNAIRPFHLVRPIPQSEIDITGGSLTQNPEYN
ncbi:RagB/SusD family nutrient uptake outer membrane protein [Belliella aquatica]|uniref:Membrane protein n=1 Tax=Belliella aquatica TaxID=1323734 RepID=A0ABQ1M323_9BACT|nr:RagB/SusD family nutrient uptake outer membrane protein [Belliella aquatica]MCH7406889.1 RagB/SusD family nutrient uptake outer membrane protein [Belliella aquatica]GGC31944.1 membrane protein [Belliella aquatica]